MGGCVANELLAACTGKIDGDTCTVAGLGNGQCRDGLCLAASCGNGASDEGEACDDGNQVSGDGCRSDCQKIERCGDGLQDAGEACDDGNANPVDACNACVANVWTAQAIVRGKADPLEVGIRPSGLAVTEKAIYVSNDANHVIHRLTWDGTLTTIAGNRLRGFSGDGGQATAANLDTPQGLAVDGLGNVYVADTINQRVRRIDGVTGVISTVIGTGTAQFAGDGGPAQAASLHTPSDVAVDGLGNLYIADTGNHRVRRVDASTGIVSTVVGSSSTPGYAGDEGPAASARLASPRGVALDEQGNLYVADTQNHRIRMVAQTTNNITTVAGNGTPSGGGDNLPAPFAGLTTPRGTFVMPDGTLLIADTGNHRIRRVDATSHVITTIAGSNGSGFSGDGGLATSATLFSPFSVALDPQGNLLIADADNNRLREVMAPSNTIETIVGDGGRGFSGDDGAALAARLGAPQGLALDTAGNVYIADTGRHRVRKIEAATGIIRLVAGNGVAGSGGDGAAATAAGLNGPQGVWVESDGDVLIADTGNNRIRRVDAASGVISTVAGTGVRAFGGDGGPATAAALAGPRALAQDGNGTLYIADASNGRVRTVDTNGIIQTIAGNGTIGYFTDDVAATSTALIDMASLAVSANGDVYISDSEQGTHRIRRVSAATGMISTVVGRGVQGFGGDNGPATLADLAFPRSVTLDAMGNLLVADTANHRVRRMDATTNILATVAGNGSGVDFGGDGGPALAIGIAQPRGLVASPDGSIYLTDNFNRVRRILPDGTLYTVAGLVDPQGTGPRDLGLLADPRALAFWDNTYWTAAGSAGVVQRLVDDWIAAVAGRYPDPAPTNKARFRPFSFGDVGGLAWDAASARFFFTETTNNRVWVVSTNDATTGAFPSDYTTWTIEALAGAAGVFGYQGDNEALAIDAALRQPSGLYFDEVSRTLLVADTGNHVVRAIAVGAPGAAAGVATIRTVFGSPATFGFAGDGGPARLARLFEPAAITKCANGDLYIADTGNHRIRRVAAAGVSNIADGVMTTVLGDGAAASSGEGAPASSFPIHAPAGVACDTLGNVFATSSTTVRLLTADDTGVVDGTREVLTIYGQPPRDEFPASVTTCLTGIVAHPDGRVAVADACSGFLVELSR